MLHLSPKRLFMSLFQRRDRYCVSKQQLRFQSEGQVRRFFMSDLGQQTEYNTVFFLHPVTQQLLKSNLEALKNSLGPCLRTGHWAQLILAVFLFLILCFVDLFFSFLNICKTRWWSSQKHAPLLIFQPVFKVNPHKTRKLVLPVWFNRVIYSTFASS